MDLISLTAKLHKSICSGALKQSIGDVGDNAGIPFVQSFRTSFLLRPPPTLLSPPPAFDDGVSEGEVRPLLMLLPERTASTLFLSSRAGIHRCNSGAPYASLMPQVLGSTIRGHVRVEQRENRCGRKMVLEGTGCNTGRRKSGKFIIAKL